MTHSSSIIKARELALRSVAGPLSIEARCLPDKPLVVGRDPRSTLWIDHPTVSRAHATIAAVSGSWMVTDLASHNGTYLCGQRLEPERPTPIQPGDLLRFGACTLRVSSPGGDERATTFMVDAGPSVPIAAGDVVSRGADDLAPANRDQVRQLTEAAVALGACRTSAEVASLAVEHLLLGTSFTTAAYVDAGVEGRVGNVLAVRSRRPQTGPLAVSRSLLAAALDLTDGSRIATLADRRSGEWGQSIDFGAMVSAIAAPVVVDGAVVAILYADARRGDLDRPTPPIDATSPEASFALGVAQVCGLALARVNDAAVRQRMDDVQRELRSAHKAQQAILPPARGKVGPVSYASLFRPGEFVAGDFFDVLALPRGGVACLLGDVSGHGLASGIYMVSLLTHLRDRLVRGETLGNAVASTNRLLASFNDSPERTGAMVFATLFAAVLDDRGAEFVDCGHGYAAVAGAGRAPLQVSAVGSPPLGLVEGMEFESGRLDLDPGSALVIVSDGVIEQPGPDGRQFGMARMLECVAEAGGASATPGVIEKALASHVSGPLLGTYRDDVTVLSVARE